MLASSSSPASKLARISRRHDLVSAENCPPPPYNSKESKSFGATCTHSRRLFHRYNDACVSVVRAQKSATSSSPRGCHQRIRPVVGAHSVRRHPLKYPRVLHVIETLRLPLQKSSSLATQNLFHLRHERRHVSFLRYGASRDKPSCRDRPTIPTP